MIKAAAGFIIEFCVIFAIVCVVMGVTGKDSHHMAVASEPPKKEALALPAYESEKQDVYSPSEEGYILFFGGLPETVDC